MLFVPVVLRVLKTNAPVAGCHLFTANRKTSCKPSAPQSI